MNNKHIKRTKKDENKNPKKTKFNNNNTYLLKCLQESGIDLKLPPEKSIIKEETVTTVRNIKKNLRIDVNFPQNVSEFVKDFGKLCENLDMFKYMLYPNIMREEEENSANYLINDSVVKILLNVTELQDHLLNIIFEKAIDLGSDAALAPWIQQILRCITTLDSIVSIDQVVANVINLMDVTSEKNVRLEIISAIPDIIGDQENVSIANELSRFLLEDKELIPAVLECLSFLSLSDCQYQDLQKKGLTILQSSSQFTYYPNFVKFLLMPGRLDETAYLEAIYGLRNTLNWNNCKASQEEIASSQTLTAASIRNSMISSKTISSAWLKSISSCKLASDHKPIDMIILLLLYTLSEEKQKQVENLIRKHVLLNIMKEELIDEAFNKLQPIFKNNLHDMLKLVNSLLKQKSEEIESFAIHWYMTMYTDIHDSRQTIVAELIQLGLSNKNSTMSMLSVLNDIASKDIGLLKAQSLQMLILLDRTEDMSLDEIRQVMKLICGLAFSFENSILKDDVHMIIRKQLSSSDPSIKIRGILAAVQGVRYLIAGDSIEDITVDVPDDISYSAFSHLSEGPTREAAQLIELISRSTRQWPDLIGFFYDELSEVIATLNEINKQFLSWLTDAVTNDLQQHFIVDNIAEKPVHGLTLIMEHCLNSTEELEDMIAMNIAGITMESDKNDHVDITILPSLFQLVQTTQSKQHNGDLSSIDALLGCPVIMPKFHPDLVDDMDDSQIFIILDCFIHCNNWYRELINAFATQTDDSLKIKVLKRIDKINEIESMLVNLLMRTKGTYKPPTNAINIAKYTNDRNSRKTVIKLPATSTKSSKKQVVNDDSILPDTGKTQATQNQPASFKTKLDSIQNLPLRNININVLHLLKEDIISDSNEDGLSIKSLTFLLKAVFIDISFNMPSKIKKSAPFLKQDSIYDAKKALFYAKKLHNSLPRIMSHLDSISQYLKNLNLSNRTLTDNVMITTQVLDYLSSFEYLLNILSSYFKWIGFKNHNIALLKTSIGTITKNNEDSSNISLKDLFLSIAKQFQKYEEFCLQLSTAIALLDLILAFNDLSENQTISNIVQDMSSNFLSRLWHTLDGIPEKGLTYNQGIDKMISGYFIKPDVRKIKTTVFQIKDDIQNLSSKTDTLSTLKCINKSNFPLLYRNLFSALYEGTKAQVNGRLTDNEHLELWKDVTLVLKTLTEIAKTLDSRNNLAAFLKKSQPILKLFLSHGMPIIEIKLKSETNLVIDVLRLLQQSTRFLQTLCCHSRLKKDTSLMSKVPQIRLLLETLIYKVKAALAANKCSEAFWMGNLKNKNIRGEVIQSQQSQEESDVNEDCDDQLPEDDSPDESDDALHPDSKSISDIV